jgi:hypothetical protein
VAVVPGTFIRNGEVGLWRNLEGTVGLPRGANDGLEFDEEGDSFSSPSGGHVSTLSPSPEDFL